MLRGVAVTVLRPSAPTRDRLGNDVPGAPVAQVVDGAIIAPGATADLEASRPEGVTVAYTVHMPPSGAYGLEGASITLPEPYGGTYMVVGNPPSYMPENMPPAFRGYVPVEVEAAHG